MKKIIPAILILFLSLFSLSALDTPALKGRVNDYANLLSPSEINEMENYMRSVELSTGAQIAVLIIPSLQGDSLEMFSLRTAREWKLGEADKNNGLLLLVAMEEKKIRIEVGYGLEGSITDSQSGYIIRNVITPEFKRGNFSKGISQGIHTLGGLIAGDIVIDEETAAQGSSSDGESLASIIPIIFFILIFSLRVGRIGSRRRRGLGAAFLMGSALNRRSSGFSSGGGFSGGGFSGGGGSFGGGGSSGGW